MTTLATPIRSSRIQLSLGQLFWRELGQGLTLVFLHGNWQTSDQWLAVIQALGTEFHCLAPDLLGCGESDRPKLNYSIDTQVECLSDYLDALHLRQVYLIGHSMGAWIAASYALKYPDRVHGLVLVSPEGVPSCTDDRWRLERWLVGQPPLFYWILCLIKPIAKLLKHQQGIHSLLVRRQQLRRSPVACRLLFCRRPQDIMADYLHTRLSHLKLPVLLLQGGRDIKETSSMAATYASLLPNVTVEYILQSGSAELPETAAEAFAREIRLFVMSSLQA